VKERIVELHPRHHPRKSSITRRNPNLLMPLAFTFAWLREVPWH